MTTILAVFIISLTISLVLTPFITKVGIRYGLLDMPNERKIHKFPVPRIGGIAIFSSFISTLIIINLFNSSIISLFSINHQMLSFLLGGIIVFGIGIYDDIKSLRASVKLFFQILGASIAFSGGLQIDGFDIFSTTVSFGLFSYFITVFWFLLFINAVNLADGLDGLAAGIVFFACLVMIILLIIRGEYLVAMITAVLGGATLGFLKYNFNPASIYLGDGGSYFLGYTIAALSIMGSFKSQVSAVMLLPLVALGVPLFDTLIAPIRRFVYGNKLFRPDSDHIHHRLIKKGLTHYGAVIVIYATTFILCLLALILVNIRDEQAGLILIMLGFCAFIIIQKLGYFEYFAVNKIMTWLRGIPDGHLKIPHLWPGQNPPPSDSRTVVS